MESPEATKASRLSQIVDALLPQGEPAKIEGDPEVVMPNWFQVDDPQVWYRDDKEQETGPQVQFTSTPAAITPRQPRTRPSVESMKSGTVIPIGFDSATDLSAVTQVGAQDGEPQLAFASETDPEYSHTPPSVPPTVTPTPSKGSVVRRTSVLAQQPTGEPRLPQHWAIPAVSDEPERSELPLAPVEPEPVEIYHELAVPPLETGSQEVYPPEVYSPEFAPNAYVPERYETQGDIEYYAPASVNEPQQIEPAGGYRPSVPAASDLDDDWADDDFDTAPRPSVTVVSNGDLPPALVPDERPRVDTSFDAMPVHVVSGRADSAVSNSGYGDYSSYPSHIEPGALSMPAPAPEEYLADFDDVENESEDDDSPIYGELRFGETGSVPSIELDVNRADALHADAHYAEAQDAEARYAVESARTQDSARWAPEPSVLDVPPPLDSYDESSDYPQEIGPDALVYQGGGRRETERVPRTSVSHASHAVGASEPTGHSDARPSDPKTSVADEFVQRVAEARSSAPKAIAVNRASYEIALDEGAASPLYQAELDSRSHAARGYQVDSTDQVDGAHYGAEPTVPPVVDSARPITRRQARIRAEVANASATEDRSMPADLAPPVAQVSARKFVLGASPFTSSGGVPRRETIVARPLDLSARPGATILPPSAPSQSSGEVPRMGRRAARLAEELGRAARDPREQ